MVFAQAFPCAKTPFFLYKGFKRLLGEMSICYDGLLARLTDYFRRVLLLQKYGVSHANLRLVMQIYGAIHRLFHSCKTIYCMNSILAIKLFARITVKVHE